MEASHDTAEAGEAGPLTGLTVLELDNGLAQYCGKLLADMGADVIKVEPPGGCLARAVPPYAKDEATADSSLFFWHYNLNKRSVVLDLETSKAQQAFQSLVQRADIVLDGLDVNQLDRYGLPSAALRQLNPRLIYVQLTPFGTSGPWSAYQSSDLVQLALGGTMTMTGYDDHEDYSSYPIAPAGGHAAHLTGVMATIAIGTALLHRENTGIGQHIDIAAHDVISASNELGVPYWVFKRGHVRRHTGRHAAPHDTTKQMFRCRDGKYAMCLTRYMRENHLYVGLVDWLESRGLAEDLGEPYLADPKVRVEHEEHVLNVIERACAQLDSHELFHESQAKKLPWSPINAPWDLLDEPHLKVDRQAVVEVENPELGATMTVPGAPYKFEKTPWTLRRLAPKLGADTDAILDYAH